MAGKPAGPGRRRPGLKIAWTTAGSRFCWRPHVAVPDRHRDYHYEPPPGARRCGIGDSQTVHSEDPGIAPGVFVFPMKTTSQAVKIYDTTLRDGTQGEGISFSVADK